MGLESYPYFALKSRINYPIVDKNRKVYKGKILLFSKMLQYIKSGPYVLVVFEDPATNKRFGMEQRTLDDHLGRHPDIAGTGEDYLKIASQVIEGGRPYKNGKVKGGIFTRGYNSPENGCFVVNTVHRRFNNK